MGGNVIRGQEGSDILPLPGTVRFLRQQTARCRIVGGSQSQMAAAASVQDFQSVLEYQLALSG